MTTVVTKLPCAKDSAPDRSAHTIGILGTPILYFCGGFISSSSGTAVGGKGLIDENKDVCGDNEMNEGTDEQQNKIKQYFAI